MFRSCSHKSGTPLGSGHSGYIWGMSGNDAWWLHRVATSRTFQSRHISIRPTVSDSLWMQPWNIYIRSLEYTVLGKRSTTQEVLYQDGFPAPAERTAWHFMRMARGIEYSLHAIRGTGLSKVLRTRRLVNNDGGTRYEGWYLDKQIKNIADSNEYDGLDWLKK